MLQKQRIARTANTMIWLFFLAFIQVLDGASWTIVGNAKYNILDTFTKNVLVPYEEGKELCEFEGENSRLFEPTDEDMLSDVLNKIKRISSLNVPDNAQLWINAIRSEPYG